MRVCFVTPGQPSNNPRFVKEADALSEAGHTVHAICGDCGLWPSQMDPLFMRGREWTWQYAGGTYSGSALRHGWTRVRHRFGRTIVRAGYRARRIDSWACARLTPELNTLLLRHQADLYIAHHPSVLDAAVAAADAWGASVGYDIEDLYWAMDANEWERDLIQRVEARCLKRCCYVTAAADGFAAEYQVKYGIDRPTTTLNVFPLADRPVRYRETERDGPLTLYWFSQVIGRDRGLNDVIAAMAICKDCRIQLHIRGNWLRGYESEFRELVSCSGLHPHSVHAYGPAPPDEMVRLAAQYDVGLGTELPVNRSRDLGLTNKVFVYLLAGNAIAMTSLSGQRHLAGQIGDAASVFTAGVPEELASILKRWHDDRSKLDSARRHAWTLGTERYNWDREKTVFLSALRRGNRQSVLGEH